MLDDKDTKRIQCSYADRTHDKAENDLMIDRMESSRIRGTQQDRNATGNSEKENFKFTTEIWQLTAFGNWKLLSWAKTMQSLADAWPFSGGNKKDEKEQRLTRQGKSGKRSWLNPKLKHAIIFEAAGTGRDGTGRTNPAKSGSAKFRHSRSWQWLLRPVWQDAMNYHIVLLLLKNTWDLVQVYLVLMSEFYSFREHSPTFLAPSRCSTIFYKLRTQGRGV